MGTLGPSSESLAGRKVVLAGGDRRNEYLAPDLAGRGADVWLVRSRPFVHPRVRHTPYLGEGLEGASVLVCPMPPFGADGRIWSEEAGDVLVLGGDDLALMRAPSLFLAGSFPPALVDAASRTGCRLVSLGELDELAILNSVATAEGALMMALERATVTLRRSTVLVLGCGRTGTALVVALAALGARVVVAARRPEVRALALTLGAEEAVGFGRPEEARGRPCLKDSRTAGQVLGEARFVFNTVPAPILTAEALSWAHPRAVIIDLASSPGGTDFAAAARLGISAVLAPSLPGKVAPETSAACLAKVVLSVTRDYFGGGEGR